MDEVYVTAGLKGKKGLNRLSRVRGLKRRGRGTYAVDKPPILGVVQREVVRLIPMADVDARTVLRHLSKNSKPDEIEAVYTDDYTSYNFLDGITPMKP